MKTSDELNDISSQYQGFLKMPHILKATTVLDAEAFETTNNNPVTFSTEELEDIAKHLYLGKRAELYMLSYVKNQQHLSKVLHSIQIQNENTTLGEIDFLFFNKSIEKWVHLELVTKFYIYNSNDSIENHTHWIGPNLKDKFEYKLEKLSQHQLPLLNHPEAQNKLNDLQIDFHNLKTQLCYKAKLFLPADLKQFQHQVTNPDCVCGTFFNLEHFKGFEFEPYLFYIPEKLNWVKSPELQTHWYSYNKALTLLKSSLKDKRSCLLWRKTPDGEYLQDFVVWW